jgi:hypothetical protein
MKQLLNKDVHRLCNETIAQFLQQPNRCFEIDIDIIQKCLQANSIYASRKGQNNNIIVHTVVDLTFQLAQLL